MSVSPEKWGVIYNPKAGTRKVKKRWNEIREYMDSKGVQYDYVQSEGFGSVERLASILANNGYRTIVIVGGDGALNDAINGIMLSEAENKEQIAIGIIPNGIGNDFAKYWEMSTDYKVRGRSPPSERWSARATASSAAHICPFPPLARACKR